MNIHTHPNDLFACKLSFRVSHSVAVRPRWLTFMNFGHKLLFGQLATCGGPGMWCDVSLD